MEKERWVQIKNTFSQLSDLSRSDRDNYFKNVFRYDSSMRLEIEDMLVAHDGIVHSENYSGSSIFDPQQDALPKKLGNFAIIAPISSGGMGNVYHATHPEFGEVALKVLPQHLFDRPQAIERFKREAEILSTLAHRNIVPIFPVTEDFDGAELVIAMQFLSGGTLRNRARTMSLENCIDLIVDLSAGLQHAHEKGFLHRDIKPDNILFNGDKAMLSDFGIARATTPLTQLTQTGTMVGTPDYMSPEQVVGGEIDTRSDIYSLGIVLYELLTGRLPYRGDSAVATGILHVTATPAPLPAQLRVFQPLIDDVLSKKTENRPASAEEFALQFQQLSEGLLLPLDTPIDSLWSDLTQQVTLTMTESSERRRITVLCVKPGDFLNKSAQEDPEDVSKFLARFQSKVAQVVRRNGGYVEQNLKDGVMAYFGFPLAKEDDAKRAVQTALEIKNSTGIFGNRSSSEKIYPESGLRIGVHTGLVVTSGVSNDGTVALGATPSIAEYLQGVGVTNDIVISTQTKELLENQFELEKVELFDKAAPLNPDDKLFRVIAQTEFATRFAARYGEQLTTLYGREAELTWLTNHWFSTGHDREMVLLVSGEAGIGKSGLIDCFVKQIDHHQTRTVIYQCAPHHSGTAFYPVSRYLANKVDLNVTSSPETIISKLAMTLGAEEQDIRDCAQLLTGAIGEVRWQEMLDPGSARKLTAVETRAKTVQILVSDIVRQAQDEEVLLVLEDAHWADASTLEWIDTLRESCVGLPVLVVLTARPEWQSTLSDVSENYLLELHPLNDQAIEKIVKSTAGSLQLPDEVVRRIVAKTDGVPLFAEEVTKAMADTNFDTDANAEMKPGIEIDRWQVPSTLHDLLVSRLDRMASAKLVAQTASCFGREFQRSLLRSVMSVEESEFDAAIAQLIGSKIIGERAEEQGDVLSFNHALVRDAAYSSLLKTKRKQIHGDIYHLLKQSKSSSEVLAFHAAEATYFDIAIQHYEDAGVLAAKNAAFTEAISHFEQAVQLTREVEDTRVVRAKELSLLVQQAHASTAVNGFAHPTTVRSNIAARQLLDRVGDTPYRFPILYGHWVISYAMGKHRKALRDATEMLSAGEKSKDRTLMLVANRVLGSSRTMMADFDRALENFGHFQTNYDQQQDCKLAFQYGTDPFVTASTSHALALVCRGEIRKAMTLLAPVEEFANQLDHANTTGYALSHLALVSQAGNLPSREKYIRMADAFAEERDMIAYRGHTLGIHAMYLYDIGQFAESEMMMRQSLEIIAKTKTDIYTPILWAYYAASLLANSKLEEAVKAETAAYKMVDEGHEQWSLSEVHRVIGSAYFDHQNNPVKAFEKLGGAINIATEQGAGLWLLRATSDQLRVAQSQADTKQATVALQSAVERFPDQESGHRDLQIANDQLRNTQ